MTAISARTTGILYIVATPIGNRDDISFRALNTLKSVDIILAEDTRHSMNLLSLLGIKKPLVSMHAHNEEDKSASIIASLLEGKSFALISDAGTPLISDPGYTLVKLAKAHLIQVVPIPGACAFIAALSAAGIPCDTFTFFGFLPAKRTARREKLTALTDVEHTLIFYESTHRIVDCISDIIDIYGASVELVIAKELTKAFECIISGTVTEINTWLHADSARCKGEFVLIIPPRVVTPKPSCNEAILTILLDELPLKQAVKIAEKLTDSPKNILYKMALDLQKNK